LVPEACPSSSLTGRRRRNESQRWLEEREGREWEIDLRKAMEDALREKYGER